MHYTLHQLQVFAKIVQLKSITKASVELHMTQPAVSIQLKNFQDQFEIPLTEVVGRQLYVTDFGLEVYKMAQRVINEVDAINHRTLAYKGHLTGRLQISVVSTGKYVMPYFLSAFLKKNEGVDLVMDVTNKSLSNNILFYINPFSKGLIFNQKDIDQFLKQLNLEPESKYYLPCSNIEILKRCLNNLIFSYEKLGYLEKVEELKGLESQL